MCRETEGVRASAEKRAGTGAILKIKTKANKKGGACVLYVLVFCFCFCFYWKFIFIDFTKVTNLLEIL